MRRLSLSILAVLALVAGLLSTSASVAAPPDDHLDVYVGELAAGQISEIVDLGVDRHDLQPQQDLRGEGQEGAGAGRGDHQRGPGQASCAKQGVKMSPKKVDGKTAAERSNQLAADGYEVFKKYSGENGHQGGVRAGRGRQPGDRQGRHDRQDGQGPGHHRAEDQQERAQGQGRQEAVGAVRRCPARPRVDHAGDEPSADAPPDRQLRQRPEDHQLWSTRTSCGSSRCRTRTATTSPSSPTSGCGARTCATTTTTA